MPQLRSALTSRVIVEQAKGFLREMLDVSVEEAFSLLRTYARAQGEHLTDVARRLMTDRYSRPMLVAAVAELAAGATALTGFSDAVRGPAARPPRPAARRRRTA